MSARTVFLPTYLRIIKKLKSLPEQIKETGNSKTNYS